MFHIAVCDDEEYFRLRVRNLIEEYMKNRGFACQTDLFPSGKEMLEVAESIQQYDVIFLDISMEEMDGIETARRIRQVSSNVYIVFVTAYITYALRL
ncbi:LytR/AlgR family response regulator transcription factor [Parablautia muri]|uniref:Stage 0 sporulation protein A homolog n=1 Tax=Parablautia muri TaxID=2320879 RepID=A0A9X5GTT3_9FIRM|nr:response regulator [Parablautia muri]NBJ95378.1 response regulator [Parablautia muri]